MKLTKTQLDTIRAMQLAGLDSKVYGLDDEDLLLLAMYTKRFNAKNVIKLVLDWKALGVASEDIDDAWEEGAEELRLTTGLKPPKQRTVSIQLLDKFAEATEELAALVVKKKTVPENIKHIYEKTGKIVHRATLFNTVRGKESRTKVSSQKLLEKMCAYLESHAEELTSEEWERYTTFVIALATEKRRMADLYKLPDAYVLPRIGDPDATPVSALLINGFVKTKFDDLEGETTLERGNIVVRRFNVDEEVRAAWTTLPKETKQSIIETLKEFQPFYQLEGRDEWNYRNIAIHIYNRFDIALSPTILPRIPQLKDTKPSDYD